MLRTRFVVTSPHAEVGHCVHVVTVDYLVPPCSEQSVEVVYLVLRSKQTKREKKKVQTEY